MLYLDLASVLLTGFLCQQSSHTEKMNRIPVQAADSRRDYSTTYHDWLSGRSVVPEHRGDTVRRLLPNIASQVRTISRSTLRRFRKAARDYGHLDPFLREADEAFADEMTAAFGVSRVPVPLMIPLGAGLYLPLYAVLLGEDYRNATCWDSYHRALMTILQRVARRMNVAPTFPIMYLEVTEYDLTGGMGDYDIVGENLRGMASAIPSTAIWPEISSSDRSRYGTWVEASVDGPSVYLQ
jgi:hypothetical protein